MYHPLSNKRLLETDEIQKEITLNTLDRIKC